MRLWEANFYGLVPLGWALLQSRGIVPVVPGEGRKRTFGFRLIVPGAYSVPLMAIGIYRFYRLFQPAFRQGRMELFQRLFRPDRHTRILDVGGYVYNWQDNVLIESPVTFLNLSHPTADRAIPEHYTCVVGDGRNLPFPDRSFDIVFSNSTIEHVGSPADQRRFAEEIRRVGLRYFVQTPNRWFFIEPHFVTLFIHYLPRPFARRIIRFCSFRGLFRSGDNADLKQLAAELRLLGLRELKALFPDAEIHREQWFGFTKSLIAVRR